MLSQRGRPPTLRAQSQTLACVIGVSRVAVGVHYPDDVLTGWMIGALAAAAGWMLATSIPLRRLPIWPG